MGYKKAKAEQEWLRWKNQEEEKLRKLGVEEGTIQRLRDYDWAVFNEERRYLQRQVEAPNGLEQLVEDSDELPVVDASSMLDNIENSDLLQALLQLDQGSLQILFLKTEGYGNAQIARTLKLSLTNVETKLWRIRKKLKNLL